MDVLVVAFVVVVVDVVDVDVVVAVVSAYFLAAENAMKILKFLNTCTHLSG